jgi:hypothetical protein
MFYEVWNHFLASVVQWGKPVAVQIRCYIFWIQPVFHPSDAMSCNEGGCLICMHVCLRARVPVLVLLPMFLLVTVSERFS